MNQTKDVQIKEAVKAHYGAFADSQLGKEAKTSSSCCGGESTCASSEKLYSGDYLRLVPEEIAQVTRGCGNPIAIASLKPGEVVLDLGSGGGLDVMLAAKRVGEEGYVYGVDMTDSMLELARQNAAKAGVENVQFLKGDIEALPLPDNSVDVIISNCVINLAPNKGDVLSEAYRVLKPGGRLAVSDVVVDPDLEGLPVSEAQIRDALSWAGCIAGAPTKGEYERHLTEAGFVAVEVQPVYRYTLEDAMMEIPESVQSLPREVASELASRFTSSSIQAVKPA